MVIAVVIFVVGFQAICGGCRGCYDGGVGLSGHGHVGCCDGHFCRFGVVVQCTQCTLCVVKIIRI